MQAHKEVEFTFKAWNLAEAQLAINAFLAIADKAYRSKQITFLQNFLEAIKSIESKVKDIYSETKLIDSNNYNIENVYANFISNHDNCMQYVDEAIRKCLLKILAEEIDLRKENSKDEIYLTLLTDLQNCCYGVISEIHRNKTGNLGYNGMLSLLKLADKFGAIVVPFSQDVDFLSGSDVQSKIKFTRFDGYCKGQIIKWGSEIEKNGFAPPILFLDAEIYQHQKNHLMDNQDVPTPLKSCDNIYDLKSMQDCITPVAGDLNIYYVRLGNETQIGHGVGIRRIPNTDYIEFKEPNFGSFIFENTQSFQNWFVFFIAYYHQLGFNLKELFIYQMGLQTEKAVANFPFIDRNMKFYFNQEIMHEIIGHFNWSFERLERDKFQKMSKADFCQMFVDTMQLYFFHITTEEQLDDFKKALLNIKFIKPLPKSNEFANFIFSLFGKEEDYYASLYLRVNQKSTELALIKQANEEMKRVLNN